MTRSTDQLSRWFLTTALVALLHAALGWLGQVMTLPPGHIPMLAPAAGLALAAVICQGARLAPDVALGAFALGALLGQHRGQSSLLVPALIGVGAALQALAGAWAIRRWVSRPLLLSEPLGLLRFYGLGAVLACVIGASFASGALWLTGSLQPQQLATHWLSWWMGETLGVLIGTPIALTLLAQPREAWARAVSALGCRCCWPAC